MNATNTTQLSVAKTTAKKPYAKPEIVFQQTLEAIAGFCQGVLNSKVGTPVDSCTVTFS